VPLGTEVADPGLGRSGGGWYYRSSIHSLAVRRQEIQRPSGMASAPTSRAASGEARSIFLVGEPLAQSQRGEVAFKSDGILASSAGNPWSSSP
jgi:hypothetical protein